MVYTLTSHLPPNQKYSQLCVMLTPQGHSDAPEMSHVWETKDSCVSKQAPRCRPNSQMFRGERTRQGHRIECHLLKSPRQNGMLPPREGRGRCSLGKAKEALRGLKPEVMCVLKQQIDFHRLEQKRLVNTSKHKDKV